MKLLQWSNSALVLGLFFLSAIGLGDPGDTVTLSTADKYKIQLSFPVNKVGKGKFLVTILPGKGFKINLEYPAKVEFQKVEGIQLVKSLFRKADATKINDQELTYTFDFTSSKTGEFIVGARFHFSVCDKSTCFMPKVDSTWKIKVQ